MIKFYLKVFFYVMGKVLSGELWTGLVFRKKVRWIMCMHLTDKTKFVVNLISMSILIAILQN